MAKPKPEDIKEEIEEQEMWESGEGELGSGTPAPDSDDNATEALEKFIGNEPDMDVSIADEVNDDEEALR